MSARSFLRNLSKSELISKFETFFKQKEAIAKYTTGLEREVADLRAELEKTETTLARTIVSLADARIQLEDRQEVVEEFETKHKARVARIQKMADNWSDKAPKTKAEIDEAMLKLGLRILTVQEYNGKGNGGAKQKWLVTPSTLTP